MTTIKNMKTKIFSAFYFLVGIQYVLSQYFPGFIPDVIVKALIIPLLMLILWTNVSKENMRMNIQVFCALIFSWAGDITLEFAGNNGNMFILGLLFFLFAHIMYLAVFVATPGNNSILNTRKYLIIPVLLYGITLVVILYNDLGEMKIPVILYALVILLMLTGALNRIEKVNRKSYWFVLAGAILFVISDSSIAINKFSMPFKGSSIVIMSTYILAQYLIVQGYIFQYRKD
jgi:uncharacterized membrane protein YhhN